MKDHVQAPIVPVRMTDLVAKLMNDWAVVGPLTRNCKYRIRASLQERLSHFNDVAMLPDFRSKHCKQSIEGRRWSLLIELSLTCNASNKWSLSFTLG